MPNNDAACSTVASLAVTVPMKPMSRNAVSAPSTVAASSDTSMILVEPSKPAISETVSVSANDKAVPPLATTVTASNRVTRSS